MSNIPKMDNPEMMMALNELVANAMLTRTNLLEKLLDPRRDIDTECGYIDTSSIRPSTYAELYDRHPIANRVVSILPKECWKITPEIYEDEDNDVETEFEKDWKELCQTLKASKFKDDKQNPVWELLARADRISGIGHFGIVLIGINDGKRLDEPAPGFEEEESYGEEIPLGGVGTDAQYFDYQTSTIGMGTQKAGNGEKLKVIFLKTFDETLVEVVEWESNQNSPRFSLPKMYNVTLSDPTEHSSGIGEPNSTIRVHWSRIIHIVDTVESNDSIGVPRMRPVINPLSDLKKIYGGSSEGYWQTCLPGVILESEPGTTTDVEATRQGVQNYIHRMQRWLALSGMTAKTLQASVNDPTSHVDINIAAICIYLGCPRRIFEGSERGELASTQDKDSWEERLIERRTQYLSPKLISPFVDRLIKMGVLTEPESYTINWESVENLSKLTKAQIAGMLTDVLSKYIAGGVDSLIEPVDFLAEILGWPQEKIKKLLDNTVKHLTKAVPDAEGDIIPGRQPKEPTPPELQQPPKPNEEKQPPGKEGTSGMKLKPSVVKKEETQ